MFFKQVQNKMHWAAYKHIAADKRNIELTSWTGEKIKCSDVGVAKNYLDEKGIYALNKIVIAYLDIAEVRAIN